MNDETPRSHRVAGTVLVVGPTSGYSRHIRDIVQRLGDGSDQIVVLSMPELMGEILKLVDDPTGPASSVWFDADSMLGRLARLAIDLCRKAGVAGLSRKMVYECLQMNRAGGRALTQNVEWSSYLRSLPVYKKALSLRVHRPLLSLIEWEVDRPSDFGRIGHVIVDEAQDVTALEWSLLRSISEGHAVAKGNSWTILGDLNQRRSDHTLSSWDSVFDETDLDPDTKIPASRARISVNQADSGVRQPAVAAEAPPCRSFSIRRSSSMAT